MKELPNEQTMNELMALAKDAHEKAKVMHDTAAKIAQKWQHRNQSTQDVKQIID